MNHRSKKSIPRAGSPEGTAIWSIGLLAFISHIARQLLATWLPQTGQTCPTSQSGAIERFLGSSYLADVERRFLSESREICQAVSRRAESQRRGLLQNIAPPLIFLGVAILCKTTGYSLRLLRGILLRLPYSSPPSNQGSRRCSMHTLWALRRAGYTESAIADLLSNHRDRPSVGEAYSIANVPSEVSRTGGTPHA
jgi:hypothetical protein